MKNKNKEIPSNSPIDDRQADVLRDKAMVAIAHGDWECALENLKIAHSIRPYGPYIKLQLINVLVQLKRFDEINTNLLNFLYNPQNCFQHNDTLKNLLDKLCLAVRAANSSMQKEAQKKIEKTNIIFKKLFLESLIYSSQGDSLVGYRYPLCFDISKLVIKSDQIHILGLQDVAVVGRGFIVTKSTWTPVFDYNGLNFFPDYVGKNFHLGKCYCSIYIILGRKLRSVKVDTVATVIHYNANIYGHFLLEILPRIFVLKEFFKLSVSPPPLALPINIKDWLKRYILEIWGDWGVIWFNPDEEYISADQTFVVTGSNLHLSPKIVKSYISFAEQNNSEVPKKILISRPIGHRSRRTLENFNALKAIAVDKGYEIVEPAALGSLQKQANLFNKCSIVLGEFTSALHNTLFSPFGTYIGCLNYLFEIQNYIAAAQGHNLNYLLSEDGPIQHNSNKSFVISEAKFSKLIDDIENELITQKSNENSLLAFSNGITTVL